MSVYFEGLTFPLLLGLLPNSLLKTGIGHFSTCTYAFLCLLYRICLRLVINHSPPIFVPFILPSLIKRLIWEWENPSRSATVLAVRSFRALTGLAPVLISQLLPTFKAADILPCLSICLVWEYDNPNFLANSFEVISSSDNDTAPTGKF